MGFSRQDYWSGLPFPFPGNLPDPGLNLDLSIAADSFPPEPSWKPQDYLRLSSICRGSPSVSPENLWSRGKAHTAQGFSPLPLGFKPSILSWDQRLICPLCTSVVMRSQYRSPWGAESVFTFWQLGLYFTPAILLFSLISVCSYFSAWLYNYKKCNYH